MSSTDAIKSCINPAGGLDVNIISAPTTGIPVIQSAENYVQRGYVFSLRQNLDLTSGTYDIIIDPTLTTDKYVVFYPPVFTVANADPMSVDYYVGTTYTGGTTKYGSNRSQLATNPSSEAPIVEAPTIDVLGTKTTISWYLPGTEQGQRTTPYSAGSQLSFILNPAIVQHLRVNVPSSGATFEYNLTWFEIPISEGT